MADLSTTFTGIRFPNPFMLASAPPTESESNIRRAYDAGWGGVVTKTIGPIITILGAIVGGFVALMFVLFGALTGQLADKFGKRRIMIIANAAGLLKEAGKGVPFLLANAWLLVSYGGIVNASGRVCTGWYSDKLGRQKFSHGHLL